MEFFLPKAWAADKVCGNYDFSASLVAMSDYDLSHAFDPAASVFVSANAGAGKTSLLTNRVLRLLLHGVPPAKILCLTFTNAAAAEMMERVQRELGKWVMADENALRVALAKLVGDGVTPVLMRRARSLFAHVLEAPEGVRIQTIHGFCQSLLRRFPIEAGISPYFTVMDSRTEQEMLQEAKLRLFSRAQNEDAALQLALSNIAHTISESSFHSLLAEILKNKRRIRSLFASKDGVSVAMDAVWKLLRLPANTTMEGLVDRHFAYDDATLANLRSTIAGLLEGSVTDCATGNGLAQWLEKQAERHAITQAYVTVFVTQQNTPRKKIYTAKAALNDAHKEWLAAEQARVLQFNTELKALMVARHSCDLLHVAEALFALYEALKRMRAVMDYDDLILTARDLLKRSNIAPWVLFKLDGGIDHILVDEAQDTGPEQWAIIEALTHEFFAGTGRAEQERSIFIVGDEKQSIYSFQGADPRGLGKMQRHFTDRIREAAKKVHRISLTKSYRSTQEVLRSVDAVFARDEARSGLMFDDSVLAHIPTRLVDAGVVEIWPLIGPSEEDPASPTTRLARMIADTIHQWLKHGLMLEPKGRPVEAGDIMILVRTRTALVDRLVRALKRRGVPVAGHDRMRLDENLAVQDLMALGQCLLLPEDDLTLAALLKSPIFNVDEDTLFELAWARGNTSLWDRLREQADDHPSLAEAFGLLSDLRARADYISPFELYSHVLDTLGARQRFTGRMGEEYHDPIDEFLGQALLYERSHVSSLQGFMHWLQTSESEIKRDMEQAKNSVRIMTVHGSKGLQAPIVILPDTIEKSKLRDNLLWHEWEEGALPFWPMAREDDDPLCAGLREDDRQAMMAEYRRLLYVALTRAEDRLYICGATGKDKIAEDCWYQLVATGLSPLATPFDMPQGEGMRMGTEPAYYADARPAGTAADTGAHDFAFLARPAPEEPVPSQPLTPSRLAGTEPASASPLAQQNLYQRGTFIHKLLQYLPEIAPEQRMRAAQSIAAAYSKVLPPDMVAESIAEALAVIGHSRFAFLFAAGSLAEVPIAGCVTMRGHKVTVAGQIDRLHIGENEVWIADFKSNRALPEHASAIPVAYLRQMHLYQLLLRKIYPEKTVRCALVWTAAAEITVLDDTQLDEAASGSYI
jgi:ATP-dependent helicase/nuclease subunit A